MIENTDKGTLQDFVAENAKPDAVVYTDDAAAYEGIPNPHESVRHSVSEYSTAWFIPMESSRFGRC